ncbi:hypothetical protein ACHAXT_000066 [Thalassiosira profunda]
MAVLAAPAFDDMIYNYGRFHNNRTNRLIHLVFIPIIQFTLFILGALHGHSARVPCLEGVVPRGIICVETWTLSALLLAGYFAADVGTAAATALWSFAMLVASQHIVADEAYKPLTDAAPYLHGIAWLAQFYGHGVHEKRAPALASNLLYALLAPFFVTFEVLHGAFAYHKDRMPDIRARIEADIAEFRSGKGKGPKGR